MQNFQKKYENYINDYEIRVAPLIDAALEKRIPNYWTRVRILQKFDDWFYNGGERPRWYKTYKEKQGMKIETPENFIRGLNAMVQFVKEQLEKDPNFDPGEKFVKFMVRVRSFLDELLKGRTPPANVSVRPSQQEG